MFTAADVGMKSETFRGAVRLRKRVDRMRLSMDDEGGGVGSREGEMQITGVNNFRPPCGTNEDSRATGVWRSGPSPFCGGGKTNPSSTSKGYKPYQSEIQHSVRWQS